MNDTMIVCFAGFIVSMIAIITPIIKLNTNIVKLNTTLELIQKQQKEDNKTITTRITEHGKQIDDLEKTTAAHGARIEVLEKK